jgi:hypothetical protein
MTAEQHVPTPSPIGPLTHYEQSIIDRINDFNDPHQEAAPAVLAVGSARNLPQRRDSSRPGTARPDRAVSPFKGGARALRTCDSQRRWLMRSNPPPP